MCAILNPMDNSHELSLEEAAKRLVVSLATARRWAASGRLPALKVGKQWTVSAAGIEAARSSSAPAISLPAGTDLDVALTQVARRDLREVWVPDVLQHEDWTADRGTILTGAAERLMAAGPFDRPTIVEVAKSPYQTRPGALLSVVDRVAYHATALGLASAIHGNVPEGCYATRPSSSPRYLLERMKTAWMRWRSDIVSAVTSESWVVRADVSAFFEQVQHRSLFADLDRLPLDPMISKAMKRMLGQWSDDRSVGLPQGPDASRLIATYYLFPLDEAMGERPWRYFRFMDDICVVTSSRREAVEAMRMLEAECRRRGLVLSGAKSGVSLGPDGISDLTGKDMTRAQYLLQAGDIDLGLEGVRAVFHRALDDSDQVDVRRARFSLGRLRERRDTELAGDVLDNLERLAPVANLVGPYLLHSIDHPSAQFRLHKFLGDPDRNTSPYLSAWLVAAVADAERVSAGLLTWCRGVLLDRNEPAYLRALTALVVAKGIRRGDADLLREGALAEYDPTVVRGYLVALARRGELDKSLSRAVATRLPRVEATVRYLREATRLPFVTYHARSLHPPATA